MKSSKKKSSKKRLVSFQSVKGMHDILPQDQWLWDRVRNEVKSLAEYYSFERIDTPLIEKAELFEKGVGQATDIVEKQMFFVKASKDRLVLRPEGTAPVVRSYIEHGLSHMPQPAKLYYLGPMFRHEQPQEGRFRQFYQAGFEVLGGDNNPVYDAQIILACYRLLEGLKITKLDIQINTIGCKTCRPNYRRRLVEYFKSKDICRDCRRRLSSNPLRLLDCKDKKCEACIKEAPTILDNLCHICNTHFKAVLEFLNELQLPYTLNHCLVRGLDYYNRTVFEIFAEGFDSALASGGRFDYLAEQLGGRPTVAVGGAAGMERLIAAMKVREVKPLARQKAKAFLIHIGSVAKRKSLVLIEELRKAGIKTKEALSKDSLKAQLKQADKEGAALALIFGQKEAFEGSIIIRDLESGAQETVPLDKFVAEVKRKLK